MKLQPIDCETIFENHTSDKLSIYKIFKEFLQSNNKKEKKKRQRTFIDISPRKTHKWPTGIQKVFKFTTSLIIRGL